MWYEQDGELMVARDDAGFLGDVRLLPARPSALLRDFFEMESAKCESSRHHLLRPSSPIGSREAMFRRTLALFSKASRSSASSSADILTSHLSKAHLPPALARAAKPHKNLYQLLSALPNDGVGTRVRQRRWAAKGIGCGERGESETALDKVARARWTGEGEGRRPCVLLGGDQGEVEGRWESWKGVGKVGLER